MKTYRLWVRINQTQTANTIVYAENAYMAKQLGEAQYGVGNVLNYTEVSWSKKRVGLNTGMRFYEFNSTPTIKSIKPMNPQQYRLYSLKRNKENAKKAYKAEKDRQTVAKAQQQIFKATH